MSAKSLFAVLAIGVSGIALAACVDTGYRGGGVYVSSDHGGYRHRRDRHHRDHDRRGHRGHGRASNDRHGDHRHGDGHRHGDNRRDRDHHHGKKDKKDRDDDSRTTGSFQRPAGSSAGKHYGHEPL